MPAPLRPLSRPIYTDTQSYATGDKAGLIAIEPAIGQLGNRIEVTPGADTYTVEGRLQEGRTVTSGSSPVPLTATSPAPATGGAGCPAAGDGGNMW